MDKNSSIPEDIIKIQKKLSSLEANSRNYKKYTKILSKHIKQLTMRKRVNAHIKTIEHIEELQKKTQEKE